VVFINYDIDRDATPEGWCRHWTRQGRRCLDAGMYAETEKYLLWATEIAVKRRTLWAWLNVSSVEPDIASKPGFVRIAGQGGQPFPICGVFLRWD
jgi:hypothetical protein